MVPDAPRFDCPRKPLGVGAICKVCSSPHRSSIDYFLLSGEKSQAQIASQYGLLKDSVGRHYRHHLSKRTEALAVASEVGTSSPTSTTARDLDTTRNALLDRAEALMSNAEQFYERFKESSNARDVKAALDSCRDSLRLLGDLQGAFPKAAATNIDARSLTLNGLSQDDLKTLITGIKAFQEASTFDG